MIKLGNNIIDETNIKSIIFDAIRLENDDTAIRCTIRRYNSNESEYYNIYNREKEIIKEICSELNRVFDINTNERLFINEITTLYDKTIKNGNT